MAADLNGITGASGLSPETLDTLDELVYVYEAKLARNQKLRRYYEGKVTVSEIGFDVSADDLTNNQVCFWPEKAVDALAERVRLDGFVFSGEEDDGLARIVRDTGLVTAYNRHLSSKYIHGCMFATVNKGERGPVVRFHTAETASAIPDGDYDSGIIGAGMAIARSGRTPWSGRRMVPTQVNVYEPGQVSVIRRVDEARWEGETMEVPEQQPMMYSFAHKPTGTRPFGKSRITPAVMTLTEDAVRTMFRLEVLSACYAMPRVYALGLTDEQFDALMNSKSKAYMDRMFLSTRDEDGNTPDYGQLSSNSPEPFLAYLRALAAMFAGATGVPLNSLGIVQDNPSSAEAIAAAREDLCTAAEDDIANDREALRHVALMAMAIDEDVTTDELSEEQRGVIANFRNPTMPSLASTADAMVKIAGSDEGFAGTDVFYEGVGFDKATISRIQSQKRRNRAADNATAILGRSVGVSAQPSEE